MKSVIYPLGAIDPNLPVQPLAIVTKVGPGTMRVYHTPNLSDPDYWEYCEGYDTAECTRIWNILGRDRNQTINGKRYRRKYAVYTDNLLNKIPLTTDATLWTMQYWGNRPVHSTYHDKGNAVVVRRFSALESIREENLLPSVETFRNWLWDHGVDFTGSVSSMSEHLYRRSLSEPERFWIDREAFDLLTANPQGGRFGAKPGRYRDCESDDIRCAFPSMMYSREWPSITQFSSNPEIGPDTIAVHAKVRIRNSHDGWYPLPLMADYRKGKGIPPITMFGRSSDWADGLWSPNEIEYTRSLGNDVRIFDTIECTERIHFNDTWWEQILSSRQLGTATPMAKSVINCLWGRFGMSNAPLMEYSFTDPLGKDDRRVSEFNRPSRIFPTNALAFALQSAMRERIWTEAIVPCRTLYVATDGAIIETGNTPKPWGLSLGEWATKAAIDQILIKGPNCYAYAAVNDPIGYYEYIVAGARSREAKVTAFENAGTNINDGCPVASGMFVNADLDLKEINERIAKLPDNGPRRHLPSLMHMRSAFQWAMGGREISPRRASRHIGPKHWNGRFAWGVDNAHNPVGPEDTEPARLNLIDR